MKKTGLPVLIGLCGRSGAGKGTVGLFFAEEGIPVIDTDAVYREMTGPCGEGGSLSPCMLAVSEIFGPDAVCEDGSLNRTYVSSVVFSAGGKEKRELHNDVTHRLILEEAERRAEKLKAEGYGAVIIDAPLLIESGFYKKCDLVVAVDAPDDVLVRRITLRDGITEAQARARLAAQSSPAEGSVDILIDTDRSLELIRAEIGALSRMIKEKYCNEI